jgi:hypothetical protein
VKNRLSHQFGTKDRSLIQEQSHFRTFESFKPPSHSSLLFRSPLNSAFNCLCCSVAFEFAFIETFRLIVPFFMVLLDLLIHLFL